MSSRIGNIFLGEVTRRRRGLFIVFTHDYHLSSLECENEIQGNG